MTNLDAVILGIIQGLTEFLPVSSSGHLVLFQKMLDIQAPMLFFDIVVHWGTLTAVLVYFRKDFALMFKHSWKFLTQFLSHPDRELLLQEYPYALVGGFIFVANIPTVIVALYFQDLFEVWFESVLLVGIAWFVMGLLLIASRRFQAGNRQLDELNHLDAFLIGSAQGVAIMPGISRAGSTILMAMLCGIERKEAVRFSFLMSVPAIIGAGIFKLRDGIELVQVAATPLVIGFVVSAVVGGLTIRFLLRLVNSGKFYFFGYYCILMSLVSFGYLYYF